jgi:hypothetical protein
MPGECSKTDEQGINIDLRGMEGYVTGNVLMLIG